MSRPQQMTKAVSPPHVAVLAFPYGTHAAPLISIIRHLAALAPEIHFSFLNTADSNAALFTSSVKTPPNLTRRDVPEPPSAGLTHHMLMPPSAGLTRHMLMVAFLSMAGEMFRREVAEAEKEVGRRATCLVTDALYEFAAEMAAEMGVAWLAFWTTGPAALSTHFHTDLIREKFGCQGGRELEELDFIPGMSKIRVQDIPPQVLDGNLDSVFTKKLHQMARALPKATSVFINSFEALDPAINSDLDSKLQKFLNIGPLSLLVPQMASADTHHCLPWLDARSESSVAYISFGTVTVLPAHELAAIAEALEATRFPFLWSLKDEARTQLPDGFLDRASGLGKIVPWAPQVEILAHRSVGVFITHCGWNSVLEGVVSGVPMIGRPFFGDQKVNARVIESVMGIGVVIEGGTFTKSGLAGCLEVVLAGEDGRRMRERAEELKKAAREAVMEGGSSPKNRKCCWS
uniref:Glycosyltransferase n=1 Tax=Kalanchoe fedtschenkoi TaxID=63787 RepID=A0A7N1AA03_KALFE